MEREKVYNEKYFEVLDLLDIIKERTIISNFLGDDLEKEINQLTFLSVKLRQIEERTKGGNQI